jgi:hypothetical protein
VAAVRTLRKRNTEIDKEDDIPVKLSPDAESRDGYESGGLPGNFTSRSKAELPNRSAPPVVQNKEGKDTRADCLLQILEMILGFWTCKLREQSRSVNFVPGSIPAKSRQLIIALLASRKDTEQETFML